MLDMGFSRRNLKTSLTASHSS